MSVFTGAGRYLGWQTEVTPGTFIASGLTYIRGARGSTSARWVEGTQDEYVDTGDTSNRVDTIPNQPHSEITVSVPFFPSQLTAFLANCCLATGASTAYGALLPPVSMSMVVGNGLDEDDYAGVQLVGPLTISIGDPCMLNFNFVGSEKPVPHAVRAATVPAWERPLRKSNLKLATLIASGTPLTEKKFNSLVITINNNNTPLYDTRGDGIDGISDFVCDYLGVDYSLRRAYQTATEKAAYLAECGQDGPANFTFQTVCGSGTHTHEFNIPRSRYTAESIEAAKNDLMREPLSAIGLRPLASDSATLFSELQYKYTIS